MIEVENEQQAIDMIWDGIPGIQIQGDWFFQKSSYLVQRNGKQAKFTSALEAINFYNTP